MTPGQLAAFRMRIGAGDDQASYEPVSSSAYDPTPSVSAEPFGPPAPPPRPAGPPPPAPLGDSMSDRAAASSARLLDNPLTRSAAAGHIANVNQRGLMRDLVVGTEPPEPGSLGASPAPGGPPEGAIGIGGPKGFTVPPNNVQLPARLGQVGPSPGSGLKSAYDSALQDQLVDYRDEQRLTGLLGDEAARRVGSVADLHEQMAQRMARDVEIEQQAQSEARSKHEAFLQRNTELADQIAQMKVDPNRLMRNMSGGTRVMFTLGAALSGALGASAGGSNQALERVDHLIDKDIASQEAEINNRKASLSARQSIYSQMLQESGDARVARLQTQQLMWESAKQSITAQADRLGIPEMQTRAALAVNAIDEQKLGPMKTEIARASYQAFMQQAAAAAAAQRAAEQRAWDRSMQIAHLGLERDKLMVEAGKTSGKQKDDLDKEVQGLGAAMANPKLAEGRAAIDELKRRFPKDTSQGLPGLTPGARVRSSWWLNPVAGPLRENGGPVGLSKDERVDQLEAKRAFDAYRVAVTGAGASPKELDRLEESFMGARTPAEQRAAVENMDKFYQQIEGRHRAGFSDQANSVYDRRLQQYNPEHQTRESGWVPEQNPMTSDARAKKFAKRLSDNGQILSDNRAKVTQAQRDAWAEGYEAAHAQAEGGKVRAQPYMKEGPPKPLVGGSPLTPVDYAAAAAGIGPQAAVNAGYAGQRIGSAVREKVLAQRAANAAEKQRADEAYVQTAAARSYDARLPDGSLPPAHVVPPTRVERALDKARAARASIASAHEAAWNAVGRLYPENNWLGRGFDRVNDPIEAGVRGLGDRVQEVAPRVDYGPQAAGERAGLDISDQMTSDERAKTDAAKLNAKGSAAGSKAGEMLAKMLRGQPLPEGQARTEMYSDARVKHRFAPGMLSAFQRKLAG